ncbi:MAG: NUDIX domain-containing protein [Nocardioidaceae bacterium]
MTTTPRLRRAVRAFLVDPEDRVLLVRYEFPGLDVWCAPGGGIEDGEGLVAALARELLEETGFLLDGVDVGSCVAHRVHLFELGGYDGQEEWYFFLRCPAFEPDGTLTRDQLRDENLHERRWWTVPELHAAITVVPVGREVLPADGSRIAVTGPRDLPHVLERWLTEGVPTEMVHLDA